MTRRPMVPTKEVKSSDVVRVRAKWGTLSRDAIVDAAEMMIVSGRYEELTIRQLAIELRVATMTIYGHVRDRDDILDVVTDRLLERAWKPRRSEGEWKAWTAEAQNRFRQLLVTQPAVRHVYLKHPVETPAALHRMDEMIRVLQQGGCDEESALRAYAALQTYTIGFAALEASRETWRAKNVDLDRASPTLAAFTSTRQFKTGLVFILDGIERENTRPPALKAKARSPLPTS